MKKLIKDDFHSYVQPHHLGNTPELRFLEFIQEEFVSKGRTTTPHFWFPDPQATERVGSALSFDRISQTISINVDLLTQYIAPADPELLIDLIGKTVNFVSEEVFSQKPIMSEKEAEHILLSYLISGMKTLGFI